jgi:hypothetical protein
MALESAGGWPPREAWFPYSACAARRPIGVGVAGRNGPPEVGVGGREAAAAGRILLPRECISGSSLLLIPLLLRIRA